MTSPKQARQVAEAGADWIGINLHPGSKRFVPTDQIASLVDAIADPAEAVGLFVNRPLDEVIAIADLANLRTVQLHGDEPAEHALALRRHGLRVVRAFRLADTAAIDQMDAWLRHAAQIGGLPEAILVDAFVPGQPGGTGHAIANSVLDALIKWQTRAHLANGAEQEPAPKLILAGGLTPGNVAALVARVRPWMVDVASGVESSPGQKDLSAVLAFIRAARSV